MNTEQRRSAVILMVLAVLGMFVISYSLIKNDDTVDTPVTSFEECVAAGNPVAESYPEQCSADGKTYTYPEQTALEEAPEQQ